MLTKEGILYSAMDRANSANINMRDKQLRSLKEKRAAAEHPVIIQEFSEQILDLEKNGLKPNEKQSTLFAVMDFAVANISPYHEGRTEQVIKANVELVKEVVRDLINQGESIAVTEKGERYGYEHLFRNAITPEWIKHGMPLLLLQTALDNGRKEQVQAALSAHPNAESGTIFDALSRGEESAERDIGYARNVNEQIEAMENKRLYSQCALSILEFAKENGLEIPFNYRPKDPVVQAKVEELQNLMLDKQRAADDARRAAQEEFKVANLKRIEDAKEVTAQQQKQEPAKSAEVKPTAPQKEQEPAKVEPVAKPQTRERPKLQRAEAVKEGLTAEKPGGFVEKVVGGRQRSDALTSTPPKPIEGVKPDGHAAKVQMGAHRQPTQRQ